MQTFKIQIEDLIGSVGDDTLISSSIQDIGAEIISVAPLDKLKNVTKNTAISSGGLNVGAKKIIAVDKSDYAAREIPAMDKARYKSTASIYAGSDTSPVFYVEGQNVFVIGTAATGETSGTLHFVPIVPTSDGDVAIAHGDATIEHFPKEAIRLLVVGGATRCLQRLLSDKTSSLPSDVSEIVLPVPPIAPAAPSFSTPGIGTTTVSSTTVSNVGTPPTYTAPVVGGATEELTASLTALTGDGLATDADFLDVSKWFTAAGEMIEDEEDIELASAQIQKIQTYIQAYSQGLQNQVNIFNDANAEYQGKLQEAIQQAQIDAQKAQTDAQLAATESQQEANLLLQKEQQEYGSNLQKFSTEIQNYQAEVAKAVQEQQSSIQNYSAKIQKHVADYQWKQGQYQTLRAEYAQGLQLFVGGNFQQGG